MPDLLDLEDPAVCLALSRSRRVVAPLSLPLLYGVRVETSSGLQLSGAIIVVSSFRLQQMFATERDYPNACSFLSVGAEYAHLMGAQYTRILFLLSEGMVGAPPLLPPPPPLCGAAPSHSPPLATCTLQLLMVDRKLSEVHQVLSQAGQLVEAWQGSAQHKEALKVFFLVLQVCHYLSAGQVGAGCLSSLCAPTYTPSPAR